MNMNLPPPPPPFKVAKAPLQANENIKDVIAKRREKTVQKTPVKVQWNIGNPNSSTKLRIVVISDSHNHHNSLNVPDGDILVHCGDFTDFGKPEEVKAFNVSLLQDFDS